MSLLQSARWLTRRLGWDLVPFNAEQHALPRRARLLHDLGIDLVLDVGANAGQFGRELRSLGYRGRIVSFEPLASAFAQLQAAARRDPAWRVLNLALGDAAGQQTLHRAANSESSSLLDMLPLHLDAAPYSRFEGDETVQVRTLDALFDELCVGARRIFLKIDTQGYEAHVLRGAERSLERIDTVQVEMSLAPLYAGQPLFGELHARFVGWGYALVGAENNFGDPRTGRLLQLDAIFHRDRPASR